MMNYKIYLSTKYWASYRNKKTKLLKSFLSFLGLLWVILALTTFFLPNYKPFLQECGFFCLLFAILYALNDNKQLLSIQEKIKDMDVIIEICIGDLFQFEGVYIIGSNATFDTELGIGLISDTSVQGQFTQKYYPDVKELDDELENALRAEKYICEKTEKPGKIKKFEIGTVARLKNRVDAYFIAIATFNEHSVASSSFKNIQVCLKKTWEYISSHGEIRPLVIPIIGSGYSRITVPRDKIVKEIIITFIKACEIKRFSEKLTIVIHPEDFRKNDIDFNSLNEFLIFLCNNPDLCWNINTER